MNPIKPDGKLTLGDNQNDFKTQNNLGYGNKFGDFQSSKLSAEEINKMKCINVVTGF